MRCAKVSLFFLLCVCLIALVAGCGSTSSDSDDGSFTLSADSSVTIAQGQTRTFTVTPATSSNFKGSIQVSVSGMPSGVTLSPASATVSSGAKTTFTLTAAADAAVGTTTLVVQGISGDLNARTAVSLTVTASTQPPSGNTGDFTLTATPPTITLTPGASAQVTLNSTAVNGFSGTIAVAVSGLPTGVTASPATITVTPNNPTIVTLTAASNAPATATPVQVKFTGTSGSLKHTATILVSVSVVADFTLAVTPDSITVAQGAQSDMLQLTVTGSNGFTGDVTYTVSGLPTGVTLVPVTGTLEDGWIEPMVFNAAADAAVGNATVTITGTSGVLSHSVTVALTVTAPAPPDFVDLALTPDSQTLTVGSIATVSITATATDGYTGPVDLTVENLPTGVTMLPATVELTAGEAKTITLVASGQAQPGSATVTFVGKINSVTGSADLGLTVVNPVSNGLDVPTWHYDSGRTGLNASETVLTPTNVTATSFGKARTTATDGAVDAQPLYLSGVTISGTKHNVVYAATENDTVYAWDATSGTQLWKTPVLESGETAADNQGCSELGSKVGITATPVIDRNFGPDGAIFFVAKTKGSDGAYHQRLYALDITTGAELSGSPAEITAASFDPKSAVERAALLVNNGIVYLTWATPCHQTTFDYNGSVMAYNEGTLEQLSVLDVTPKGSGGGIWMSGAGPAADANGNVYLITSTGTFDTTLNGSGMPTNGDYGNGYVRIQAPSGALAVSDFFEPLNGVPGAPQYADQGSGGVMLTQSFAYSAYTIPPLLVGAGKDGNIYWMNGTGGALGEYNGTTNGNARTLTGALPNGVTSSPAYFNGSFFYGGSNDAVKAFGIVAGGTVSSHSSTTLGTAGATPVISANGTSTAILWALDTAASGGPVLHAYSATNLATELYNSTTQASRDAVGAVSEHSVPVVANGKVYIGTESGLDVFGLLP